MRWGKVLFVLVFVACGGQFASGQAPAPQAVDLTRHYQAGQTVRYRIKLVNRGDTDTLTFGIETNGVVRQQAGGRFVEEIAWSAPTVNGARVPLSAAGQAFRQLLSLDRNAACCQLPDLNQVPPILVDPVRALAAVYGDMLVVHNSRLNAPGDQYVAKSVGPTSWADGRSMIVGEDAVSSTATLKSVDRASGAATATLVIRHTPADPPRIKIPAEWMLEPVGNTSNNWVEVEQAPNSRFTARVGQETTEVTVVLGLTDGHIAAATVDTVIHVLERQCGNAALTACGPPVWYDIHRNAEVAAESVR